MQLTLEVNGDAAVVRVADQGSGIAPADLEHIFDRFYRADSSRARDGGGSGLGLAIAHWIVERHGGAISAESAPEQGHDDRSAAATGRTARSRAPRPSDDVDGELARAAAHAHFVAVLGCVEAGRLERLRPPTEPMLLAVEDELAGAAGYLGAQGAAGRPVHRTSLAPPEMRTGTTPDGGRQPDLDVAGPAADLEGRSSRSRRSAASFHMPPFIETSQGTAGLSQTSDLAARQSNGRKRRL